MFSDFTMFLWLLKLGALVNFYFLANIPGLSPSSTDAHVVIPAHILFAVSAYRCLLDGRRSRGRSPESLACGCDCG